MNITIRYFAGHRDITGCAQEQMEVPSGMTIGRLWELLAQRYPRLAPYQGKLLYAINQSFGTLESELHEGDEVVFLPPVSGGAAALFQITHEPLDPAPLVALVENPEMGAIVTFAGVVRNNFGGRATAYLEYQAYEPMATTVLAQLADEARLAWNTGAIVIHHRIGRLAIGETAVLIVVAAAHRREAFAAAEQIMDRIKEVAPIWKKEIWADGASEWVGHETDRRIEHG